MRAEGRSVPSLKRQFGISKQRISQILRQTPEINQEGKAKLVATKARQTRLWGAARPAKKEPRRSIEQWQAQVLALRGQGWLQVEIAGQLGISQQSVSKILRAAGLGGYIGRRRKKSQVEHFAGPVMELRAAKWAQEAIGAELGIAQKTVWLILRKSKELST